MVLYSGGLIIESFLHLRFGGAYFQEGLLLEGGLLSEFYGTLVKVVLYKAMIHATCLAVAFCHS